MQQSRPPAQRTARASAQRGVCRSPRCPVRGKNTDVPRPETRWWDGCGRPSRPGARNVEREEREGREHAIRDLGRHGHRGQRVRLRRDELRISRRPGRGRGCRHGPPRAGRRDQSGRHRRRLHARRVRGGTRPRAQGTARGGRPGDQVRPAHGPGAEPVRRLGPLDPAGGRGQPAPAGHRLHRPLPDAPAGLRHRSGGDAGHALRPGPLRQGPGDRGLDLPGRADRGGPVGRAARRAPPVHDRAAALPRSSTAPPRRTSSRPCSATARAC